MHSLPLLLLLCSVGSHGFPAGTSKLQEDDTEMVQKYLENFYNLTSDGKQIERQRNSGLVVEKLKQMQKFFGLKVTGKPDAATRNVMKQARCGVPDVASFASTEGNPRWKYTKLTYRIENYTPDLPKADVKHAIEKAFQLWSNVTPLTFTSISKGEPDIRIIFARGDHKDNSPFDGPGGVLAHAFAPGPGYGGDVHFDQDEKWTSNFRNLLGYNLYHVAAHEVGHSLGLFHSNDIGALMYPTYTFTGDVTLSQDDINAIQAIYGTSETTAMQIGAQTPQMCDSKLTFDAVTTLRGEVMFFKDRFYMRASSQYLEPELNFISVFWPNLPNKLQAAYEVADRDEIRFFKDHKYWAAQGENIKPGYPKDIYRSFGFPRSVKKIDAAVFDEATGKTYFFIDDKYWRYDEYEQSMDKGYPKMIAAGFPGIGRKVDAVFQKDGFLYFFHGTRQYKFDPETKRILTLQKANSWFNCGQS